MNALYAVPMEQTYDLQVLTNNVVTELLPLADQNKCVFLNDIPARLFLGTDPVQIATVLKDLLFAVVSHAKDTCIQLSAKIYTDVVLIHVKDCSTFNSYAVESGLQRLKPIAESMGGFLSITSLRKKVTTVAFCFPNLPLAA
jgi:signal transduction histidine kinase